jgi:subtilisin family serine protease
MDIHDKGASTGRGPRRRRLAVGLAAAASITLVAAGGVAFAGETDTPDIRGTVTDAFADSYIVKLASSETMQAADVDSAVTTLSREYGGQVTYRYHSALKGYAVTGLDEAQARELAADDRVDYVEHDGVVNAADTQDNAVWGLDRADQRDLPLNQQYTYTNTAANVHVYVIDSGIRLSHQEFEGRAVSGFDAIDGGSADDCHGHGTHVAGTVGGKTYGVAKKAKLVAVRVFDCNGKSVKGGTLAAIDWVTANAVKPAVANMSLGSIASSATDDAVRKSIATGITYVVSAGNNSGDACERSPARTPEAITVGATTKTDARAVSFSNFGRCLDLFAPGAGITSAAFTGDTATADKNGTSMAAPHVAGAAALLASANPTWTPQQIRDAIVNAGTTNKVTSPGDGSPNVLLHIPQAGPNPNPPAVAGTIKSNWNGKCIDVPAANFADGQRLSVWDCHGGTNQRWEFTGGALRTQNNKCMDVAWGSHDNGAAIQLVTCSGNGAQQFVLNQAGDLVNPQSNKCVDIAGWNGANGALLHLWQCAGGANQKWHRA